MTLSYEDVYRAFVRRAPVDERAFAAILGIAKSRQWIARLRARGVAAWDAPSRTFVLVGVDPEIGEVG